MKNTVLLILVLLSINSFAQHQTTTLNFNYIEDENQRLINELNGIKILNISCSDTLMLNHHFFLSIDEYKSGKLIKTDSLGLNCEPQEIPMIVGSDTLIYEYNMCDRIIYNDRDNKFKLTFAAKFDNDSLNLIIKYPTISLHKKLKASKGHLFREVVSTTKGEFSIDLNKRTAVLAYTNSFKSGAAGSYCLLDGESPIKWYEKFNINHFYIFYLEIR